jgi:hypothetical protein
MTRVRIEEFAGEGSFLVANAERSSAGFAPMSPAPVLENPKARTSIYLNVVDTRIFERPQTTRSGNAAWIVPATSAALLNLSPLPKNRNLFWHS